MDSVVRLIGITKRYPGGVVANDAVSLEGFAGQVHAILGENGAGKTTLMSILAGILKPDSGEAWVQGKRVEFKSPKDARRAGVGMVHQHFSLVPAMTVAENLTLAETDGSFWISPGKSLRELQRSASALGFDLRLNERVSDLSLGERQRVEIFRLVRAGANILILDEPTSILAPHEAELLFKHIRHFKETGHVIFLVTHKIPHVRAVADYVTILRKGRIVASGKADSMDDRALARAMVGDAVTDVEDERVGSSFSEQDCAVLQVQGLSVRPSVSPCGISDATFEIHAGEILGVAGMSGSGQDELAGALAGLSPYKGIIRRNGKSSSNAEYRTAFIPADRCGQAVALSLNVCDNLVLREFTAPSLSRGILLKRGAIQAFVKEKISRFRIAPSNPNALVKTMSGGNIQKLVLARELDGQPDVVVAVNPTAGLDVAMVEFVYSELREQRARGAGVLFVSEDLDDLLRLSDRIMVLYKGRIQGVFRSVEVTKDEIGLLMSGIGGQGKVVL